MTLEQVTRTSLAAFEEAIADVDAIVASYRMMGQPDYLLHIAVADLDAYERLYTDHLAGLPYVHILTSQVTMKTVKRTTALPRPH